MAASTKAPFTLDNRFPSPPTLGSLSAQDQQTFNQWWYDVRLVLKRQFDSVAAEIDKKQDKP